MESRQTEPVEEVASTVEAAGVADVEIAESSDSGVTQDTADDPVLHEEFEARATELLAAAATDNGYQVERLLPHLIIVASGKQRIAFRGFAGGCMSRAAIVLTEQVWAVRRLLHSRNIPILPSMALDFSSTSYARSVAKKIGYPITLKAVNDTGEEVRVECESDFNAAFSGLRSKISERKSQLLIERVYSGEVLAAVVAGRIIATDPQSDDHGEVGVLPNLALTALPAMPYGSVRLVQPDGETGLVVESIDPLFRLWIDEGERASRIAHEVLRYEFAAGRN